MKQPYQGHIKRQLLSLEVFADDIETTLEHAEYLIMDIIGMRGRFEIDKNNNICAYMPFGNMLEIEHHIEKLIDPLISFNRYMCNDFEDENDRKYLKSMHAYYIQIETVVDGYLRYPDKRDTEAQKAWASLMSEIAMCNEDMYDMDTFVEAKAVGKRLHKMIKRRNKSTRF